MNARRPFSMRKARNDAVLFQSFIQNVNSKKNNKKNNERQHKRGSSQASVFPHFRITYFFPQMLSSHFRSSLAAAQPREGNKPDVRKWQIDIFSILAFFFVSRELRLRLGKRNERELILRYLSSESVILQIRNAINHYADVLSPPK